MPTDKEYQFNDLDIEDGNTAGIDIRVNVNYVVNRIKSRPTGYHMTYYETLTNKQSEAFWTDYNDYLWNEDFEHTIDIKNGQLIIGNGSQEEETDLFCEVFRYMFDNTSGEEWDWNTNEERALFREQFEEL